MRGLACLECSELTLKIRSSLVCVLEMYCATCGAVLSSMLSFDLIDDKKAGNVPCFVVRSCNYGH